MSSKQQLAALDSQHTAEVKAGNLAAAVLTAAKMFVCLDRIRAGK